MKYIKYLVIMFFYLGAQAQEKSLKEAYKSDFLIGTALNNQHIKAENADADALIKRHFNAITAENIMKSSLIHPKENEYNFEMADKLVAFGQANNMYVVGHTLVWHSQLTPYAQKLTTPQQLSEFMKEHIEKVAGRYAGKIGSWDVVNEALNEDGTYRNSVFYQKLGKTYIEDAFLLAAKADPTAKLYYNDYNIEKPAKRAGAIAIIKELKSKGIKIDGVGIQGHWSVNTLDLAEIEEAILAFSALGVEVAFTELDLTVLPNPWDMKGADVNQSYALTPSSNPYTAGLPAEVDRLLAQKYQDLFKLFLKHHDKISRVTFWGLDDGHTWLNNFPIRGRTNYPLIFDRNYQAKSALNALLDLKN